MSYRTVVMYVEIGCFVVCVSGWILVCSTMPIDIWTWSQIESRVLTTSHYFSNLWKDCVSDSTGVTDCKNIPSLLALNWDIHMCRALIIISIILAFFGSVLVLVGMKCTKIGGSEIVNARLTFAGGMNYLIGGMCSMIAFSYYGNKLRAEFQDPNYKAQKFEIGVGVFIGWGGSSLLVVGGLIYNIFAGRDGFHSSCLFRRECDPPPPLLPPGIFNHGGLGLLPADGSLLAFSSGLRVFSRHHQCLDSIRGYVWVFLNL
ncbi:claudin-10-like isoform X2 [Sander lucioperca]|uniref:claudin-10-like isoform X2 n=1 Tax=Sander lucioperca TaxID=283035 RepID=UPI001653D146|nr:claudin-10-like isoform X2 [Sander lucioperca]